MKKIVCIALLAPALSGCFVTTVMDGGGDGTVTSVGNNDINCSSTGSPNDCQEEYTGPGSLTLEAAPHTGSTFRKWNNCNYQSLETCETPAWDQDMATNGVAGNDTWTVTATFEELDPPAQAAEYTYNALGQRMTKKVGNKVTVFQYDLEGNLMAEIDGATGNPIREHVHVNGEPVAQLSSSSLGALKVQYVHADHLGTPTLLTDKDAYVVADIEATPFGETYIDYDAVGHLRRFPGQYKDEETGLHYNYFRDYDPSTGRYIQSDPIGLRGGLNTYAYVGSNPVGAIDPLGLAKICRRPLSYAGNYMSSGATGWNVGIYHQHAFYEDGTGDNTGFTTTGVFDDRQNVSQYQCENESYDDNIMRQAAANIAPDWQGDYLFIGKNCQDYIDDLLDEYDRLKNPKVCGMTRRGMRCN